MFFGAAIEDFYISLCRKAPPTEGFVAKQFFTLDLFGPKDSPSSSTSTGLFGSLFSSSSTGHGKSRIWEVNMTMPNMELQLYDSKWMHTLQGQEFHISK
ncbi:unnamed protein product [Ilex paraguariensis]|uniref:Uncharacterized protein n=1 Tax=Ilex paraguariensis TaxID=185542 RepID=A0ABC8RI26_9AQUA